MVQQIDPTYQRFMRREIDVPGKDLCDMSGAQGRSPEEFSVYNVMLPRIYEPAWQGNAYERRCVQIGNRLRGLTDMAIDFDQIFAKRASTEDSAFAWHQDCAYWPPLESDTSSLNCWLAVSDVPKEAGCLRYVPGSHLPANVRKHFPLKEGSHTIFCHVAPDERVVDVPVMRGDVVVHHERAVHSSWPNSSGAWRHAYIVGLKRSGTIAEERGKGFTHSHNAPVQWNTARKWSAPAAGA